MVDENGEPLVMYHGTNNDFYEFYENNQGIHFGTKKAAHDRLNLSDKHTSYGRQQPRSNNIMLPVFLNIRNITETPDYDKGWNRVIPSLKEQSFDGVFYTNQFEDKGSVSYIAFTPSQIKSATGNSGAFSSDNNDIRYSLRSNLTDFFTGRDAATQT